MQQGSVHFVGAEAITVGRLVNRDRNIFYGIAKALVLERCRVAGIGHIGDLDGILLEIVIKAAAAVQLIQLAFMLQEIRVCSVEHNLFALKDQTFYRIVMLFFVL